MAGAYVAKPEAIVPLVVPPGWNINWPFPGPPFPPGYAPLYSMLATADESIAPSNTAATQQVSIHAVDRGEFGTTQPSGQITWTATLVGNPLKLRIAGFPVQQFAFSALTDFEQGEDIWGSAPSFNFDIDPDNSNNVIKLKAECTPFGELLSEEKDILITAIWAITVTFDNVSVSASASGQAASSANIEISIHDDSGSAIYTQFKSVNGLGFEDDGESTVVTGTNYSATIDPHLLNRSGLELNVEYIVHTSGLASLLGIAQDPEPDGSGSASFSFDLTVRLFRADEVEFEHIETVSASVSGTENIEDEDNYIIGITRTGSTFDITNY